MAEKGTGYKVYASDDDKLSTYRRRLRRADQQFDRWKGSAEDSVRRYENLPREDQLNVQGHRVSVTTGIANIDAMFSSLTAVEVDVLVEQMGRGTREMARIAEQAMAEVWDEAKVMRRAERTVKDSLLVGIGVLKVDYEYAEVNVERDRNPDDIRADVQKLFQAADENGIPSPTPDEVAQLVPVTETKPEAVRDRIVVDYVPWSNVRWDPDAKMWEDVRWVAQYTPLAISEVKNDPAFKQFCQAHGSMKKLQALEGDALSGGKQPDPDGDNERITIVEVWDFETGTVCTFPKNAEFLLNERPNPFASKLNLEDKNPLVALVLRSDPDNVRGISDMDVLKPALDELNEYRSNLATYVARTIPKLLAPAGAMTETGKQALQNREWGAVVELENSVNPAEVQPLNPPTLPQQVFGLPEMLQNETREATGVNEMMRGIFAGRSTTATETNAVAEGGSARQAEKRNRLAQFYEDVAQRILLLMQMFYDHTRISNMVDMDGDVQWEWSADDITMDAQLSVSLSPKEEVTRQSRQEAAMAMYNLVAPMAQTGLIDLSTFIQWLMQEFGLKDSVIRTFLKNPAEQQTDKQAALQDQANQQAVANGETPSPASVPGPQTGAQVAAAANPGELDPNLAVALAQSFQRRTNEPATPDQTGSF